jgi:hypothetical protein
MPNTFTLVVNAGRSGSSFLCWLLNANYKSHHVSHEEIPVNITKPKIFNRIYDSERLQEALNDPNLAPYLHQWKNKLLETSVIETGWTACHLAPVLYHIFGNQFRIIILHRNPINYAFSRAAMGSYHPRTFYGTAHDVTPFDQWSIAPEYKKRWVEMNHFEKCMFWWYIVYRESIEFINKYPEVPCLRSSSEDLFSGKSTNAILDFLGLDVQKLSHPDVPKNENPIFSRETFPICGEWISWRNHPEILRFAESYGYQFDPIEIEKISLKYRLPPGIGPWIRNRTGYWRIRRHLSLTFRALCKKYLISFLC